MIFLAFDFLKDIFGFFNKTIFERELIDHLRKSIDSETLGIIDYQMSSFTRVMRALSDDPRIRHGSTLYFWKNKKKLGFDYYTKRIPEVKSKGKTVFFQCYVNDSINNEIRADFITENGVFCRINYYSKLRIWYPKGEYKIFNCKDLRHGNQSHVAT